MTPPLVHALEAGTRVRVVADVHGEPDLLREAIEGADDIVLLGDLIDRGPDSAGSLRLALDLIESGRARLVRSNHDDKLWRALIGRPVKIGVTLSETLRQIESQTDASELKARFVTIFESAPFLIRIGRYVLGHGAIDPQVWDEAFDPDPSRGTRVQSMALYGEVDGSLKPDGKPMRFYRWIDAIPEGGMAIVGHDRRSMTAPPVFTGAAGGRAMFLDTGAGRDGPLSFIDLPKETVGQAFPAARAHGP
jgi:protein phosphatase